MKTYKKYLYSALAILATPLFAGDFYWLPTGASDSIQTFTTANMWADAPGRDPAPTIIAYPRANDTTANIYRADKTSDTTYVSRMNLNSTDITWKSVNNNNANSRGDWQIVSAKSAITLDSITSSVNTGVTFRKTDTGSAMSMNVKNVTISSGSVGLGANTANWYMDFIIVGDSADTTKTSVNITGGSYFTLVTKEFTNYGIINVAGAEMRFIMGAKRSGDQYPDYTSPNVTLNQALNLGDDGKFRYTQSNNTDESKFLDGYVDLKTVNVTTSTTAKKSILQIITKATPTTVGETTTYGAEIGTISLGVKLEDFVSADLSTLDMLLRQDTHIKSIVSNTIAGSSDGKTSGTYTTAADNQGITITNKSLDGLTKYTTYVDSMSLAVVNLVVSGNLEVAGNFESKLRYSTGANYTKVNLSDGSLTIKGELVNNGAIGFDEGIAAGESVTVNIGGISGGAKTTNTRITTYGGNSSTPNRGDTIINLTGEGTYTYTGRIHDLGQAVAASAVSGATMNIVKNGTGTQIFNGYVYYRGDTTINSGALFISTNNNKTTNHMGISRVFLNGGKFGAHGKHDGTLGNGTIGYVEATDFTWKDGAINVGVDGKALDSIDRIMLSGNFKKDALAAADQKFLIEFELFSYEEDFEYNIMSWGSDATVDFIVGDFTTNIAFNNPANADPMLKAQLRLDLTSGLYVTFTQIPEPSTYAALLGLMALAFVCYKRKNKKI